MHIVALLVILQDVFSRQVLFIEKNVLSLSGSLKRNMALLGSNHARNRAAAQDAKDRADRIRPFLLRVVVQCQEKPIDEAFPVLAAHAAVVVDVALEVSEDALKPVVSVWHPIDL